MAITLAPSTVCSQCGDPVEPRLNGELLHTNTDRIHCLWPRPGFWRRIAGRA